MGSWREPGSRHLSHDRYWRGSWREPWREPPARITPDIWTRTCRLQLKRIHPRRLIKRSLTGILEWERGPSVWHQFTHWWQTKQFLLSFCTGNLYLYMSPSVVATHSKAMALAETPTPIASRAMTDNVALSNLPRPRYIRNVPCAGSRGARYASSSCCAHVVRIGYTQHAPARHPAQPARHLIHPYISNPIDASSKAPVPATSEVRG